MAVPIANLSAVVTGAVHAAKALATEMLPAAVAWFLRHLWAWLVAARAVAVENLPAAAAAAKSAAGSAVEMAAKLLRELYGRLVAASAVSVENLREASAAMARGGAAESTAEASSPSPSLPTASWFLLLVLALLAAAFLCGAVWALTCRSMKGPGLGGARVPRAMFEANPKRYYATVRAARRARRDAGTAKWKLLVAAAIVAYTAYLVAKTLNWGA